MHKWTPITWPDTFLDVQKYFDTIMGREDKTSLLDEMEEDMKRFLDTSRKLLRR